MLGGIHADHVPHDRGRRPVELEAGRIADLVAAHRRGKELGVLGHRHDVVVLGERPEAGLVLLGLLVPVDRRLVPELPEERVWHALLEEKRVLEIDAL